MKTPESADCPVFLENLERMVDGCMSDEEEKEFLSSIKDHLECLEKVQIQKAYKQFVAIRVERKCCSQSLIYTIKQTILNS